jgi:hypothetical protein
LRGLLGMNDAEAVGAVDRAVHMRPKRHLGLVATTRADDGEVLSRASIAAFSAWTLAGITHGAAGGSAARAALGVRNEPLLRVELLILGRVDELGSAVNTGQGSIDVRHVLPPGAERSEPTVPGGTNRTAPDPQGGATGEARRVRSTVCGSICACLGRSGRAAGYHAGASRQNARSGLSDRAGRWPWRHQPRCVGCRGTWHNRLIGSGRVTAVAGQSVAILRRAARASADRTRTSGARALYEDH